MPASAVTQDREAHFLLAAHPDPHDVMDRGHTAFKGFERRLAHHAPIRHHRDLTQAETLAQALDQGFERRDLGRVARPELAAERTPLDVDGQAHHHLA
jgi:hypothetical protein